VTNPPFDSDLAEVLSAETDEIYVGARLPDPSAKTVLLAESNRIVKDFYAPS
jgi:hypothetical protein